MKLLRSELISVPQTLSLNVRAKRAVELMVCDPLSLGKSTPYIVTVDELSVISAFNNVFEYLPKSRFVFSREEALDEIDRIIKSLE